MPLPTNDGAELKRPVRAELDALESDKARRADRASADPAVNAAAARAALDHHPGITEELTKELAGQHKAVLELNGYNAVRTELLNAVNTLAAIPAEAIDAALAFARQAARQADLSPHPQAHAARDQMLAECNVYNAVLKLNRELEDLERRAQARERIVTR